MGLIQALLLQRQGCHAVEMSTSTLDAVTSLVTTYTYLDEDLIEQILEKELGQVDLTRAALALRLTRRALGSFITAPTDQRFANTENAAESCEVLKDHLRELINLSHAGETTENYVHLLHSYAVDIYTQAAQIAFLLSKERSIPFR